MNEKNQNIQTMKDQYNKTYTEKEIHIKYRKKELEASQETQNRIFKQEEKDLLKEKKKYEEIKL